MKSTEAVPAPKRTRGDYILSAARKVYLFFAFVSLLAVGGGAIAAVILQVGAWQSPQRVPIPAVIAPPIQQIDTNIIAQRFSPPTNLSIVPISPIITSELSTLTVLDYFDAISPNGLAQSPLDFSIIGGADAALFGLDSTSSLPAEVLATLPTDLGVRSLLMPRVALVDQINTALRSTKVLTTRTFHLTIIARDALGNVSPATDVAFSVEYGPQPVPADNPQLAKHPTALEILAREIALVVDPSRSPNYFHAYSRALSIPAECGSSPDNEAFVIAYRNSFDALKPKLSAAKIESFYVGLCAAWTSAVNSANELATQSQQAHDSAIARNAQAADEALQGQTAAKIERNVALMFAAIALGSFLSISLLLAFLMIENHSRAMREVIEGLTRSQREPTLGSALASGDLSK